MIPVIKAVYVGGLRTEATHMISGNKVITDAPVDNQGKGEAFSPSDLLCSALCSCMLTIIGIAARTHGFDIDGTKATVIKIMAANPRRVAEVIIEFNFPRNDFSEKEKKLIEQAAHTCPVALSIHPDIKQNIIFNY